MSNAPICILVFGEAGVGKTSLCNVLSGQKRPTGNSVKGVSLECNYYEEFKIKGTDQSCLLTDSVGLNEEEAGSISTAKAIKSLIKLLKNAEDGYNLIIHVMKAGNRIDDVMKKNYQLFIEKITGKKIPVILKGSRPSYLGN